MDKLLEDYIISKSKDEYDKIITEASLMLYDMKDDEEGLTESLLNIVEKLPEEETDLFFEFIEEVTTSRLLLNEELNEAHFFKKLGAKIKNLHYTRKGKAALRKGNVKAAEKQYNKAQKERSKLEVYNDYKNEVSEEREKRKGIRREVAAANKKAYTGDLAQSANEINEIRERQRKNNNRPDKKGKDKWVPSHVAAKERIDQRVKEIQKPDIKITTPEAKPADTKKNEDIKESILIQNGFKVTEKNIHILQEGISSGKYLLLSTDHIVLTESTTPDNLMEQLLKTNGFKTTEKNMNILTELNKKNRILFFTESDDKKDTKKNTEDKPKEKFREVETNQGIHSVSTDEYDTWAKDFIENGGVIIRSTLKD